MMSYFWKGNSGKGFRWPWRNELKNESNLSSAAPLLSDVAIEIELSDYHRLPTPDCESPSRLLNGNGQKERLIYDLDLFFGRVYEYYCAKGLTCIIIKWIIEILIVIFMVCFIGFFFLMVDWDALLQLKCGADALELGQNACDLSSAIKMQPLVPFSYNKMIIVGSIVILITYGVFNFLKFFVQIKSIMEVRYFYINSLHVTDHEIRTIPWPQILEKVVRLQRSQQLCVVRDLSEHDIIMRIMRKENYLIGLVNKGILAFPIASWLPGTGPTVGSRVNGEKCLLVLPRALEWILNWYIFQSMFDSKFCVQKNFLTNPDALKRKLRFLGVLMFLLCPMLVIFPVVYVFLSNAEQFYNDPSTASSRRWSNLSRWVFREFNEVNHLFKHRMNNGSVHALNYLKQFPTPLISIIAKFISFVFGGLAGILLIIGFLDESILEGHVYGRNLIWYAAVFGAIAAISRTAVSDELHVFDPEGAMKLVVEHTHYMPKRWRGKEGREFVRKEFETLFQYYGMMLLEEMASIVVTPYLLIFVVPKRVEDILRFISDYTIYVDGVGDICSLSAFDFRRHGNKKFGSPFNASKSMRSSQGKLEKSFLSFKSTYPSWESDAHGRQFLLNLQNFKDRMIQHATHSIHSASRRQFKPTSDSRAQHKYSIDRVDTRDTYPRTMGLPSADHNLGSYGLSNSDQRSSQYILEWFYNCHQDEDLENLMLPPQSIPDLGFEARNPSSKPLYGIEEDVGWDDHISERVQSHLMASTSSPFLHEDHIANQHYKEQPYFTGRWWDRSVPRHSELQDSFIEPPTFGHQYVDSRDLSPHNNDMWRSSEQLKESDSHLGSVDRGKLHSMSRTFYMGDSTDFGQNLAENDRICSDVVGGAEKLEFIGDEVNPVDSGESSSLSQYRSIANDSSPSHPRAGDASEHIYDIDNDNNLGQHSETGQDNYNQDIEVSEGNGARQNISSPMSTTQRSFSSMLSADHRLRPMYTIGETIESPQGDNWNDRQQPMSQTTYMSKSDEEDGFGFHFAD